MKINITDLILTLVNLVNKEIELLVLLWTLIYMTFELDFNYYRIFKK